MSGPESQEKPQRSWRNLVMQLLPWVVTGLLIAYLVSTTDLDRFMASIKDANLTLLLLLTGAAVVLAYLADTYSLTLAFSRFHNRTTLGDLLPVKGASYLLNILNYNAAAGSIALMMNIRRQVPIVEALGTMLWVSVLDLVILNILALGGTFFVDLGSSLWLVRGINLTFIAAFLGSLVYWNAGFDFFVLGRLRSWRIFNGFRRASLTDYAVISSARVMLIAIYVVGHYLVLPLFKINIPIYALCVYIPIITLINVFPVSVSGLGTCQVVMRYLFAAHVAVAGGVTGKAVTDPVVDAFSTAFIIVSLVFRILLGVICLPTVSRDIKKHRATTGKNELTGASATDPAETAAS